MRTEQHSLNREHSCTANATHCRTRGNKRLCGRPAEGFSGVTEYAGTTRDYRLFTQEHAKKAWRPTRHGKENEHSDRESDRREFRGGFGLCRFGKLEDWQRSENH